MGLFKRKPRTLVPAGTIQLLADYGREVIAARRAGAPVTDPRFYWSTFFEPVDLALLDPETRPVVVGELYDAARSHADRVHATMGALPAAR